MRRKVVLGRREGGGSRGFSVDAWLDSPQRAEYLPRLRSLLEGDFELVGRRTPFGAIVRTVRGRPLTSPTWKIPLLVVSVLFPTVILTVPPITGVAESLDAIDGRSVPRSFLGAVAVVLSYAGEVRMLMLFAE